MVMSTLNTIVMGCGCVTSHNGGETHRTGQIKGNFRGKYDRRKKRKSDTRWESIAIHTGAGVNAAQNLMAPSKKEQRSDTDALTKRILYKFSKI